MAAPSDTAPDGAARPAPHTKVLHRSSHSVLPVAVGGDGPYVIDSNGKRYLDASGGAVVSCLGHSDADVIAAVQAQIGRMPFAHSAFFTNEPMEQLAEMMVSSAPDGLDRVYFTSGRSEAYVGDAVAPGPDVVSDHDVVEYLRNFGNTGFHPTSTCRMGIDATAVVDPHLRVHGLEGLRVVDASIMPAVTSGNTNAPTIMLA